MKKMIYTVAIASMLALPVLVTDAVAKGHGKDKKGMMHKMFSKADANGDGAISKAEFTKMSEERFNKMDQDGDGNITKAEAENLHKAMKEKYGKKHKKNKDLGNETSDKSTSNDSFND